PGSDHWAIIAYGMVSIWLTKVKRRWRKFKTAKIGLAPRGRFSSNANQAMIIGDIAGFGWFASRQGRAGRWKTARTGIRRRSACSGCRLPRGKAGRRERPQRLRPCDG